MTFDELLEPNNNDFYIDYKIDEATMCPIFIFIDKIDSTEYRFKIPRVDILDYKWGVPSPMIDNMVREMRLLNRNKKIDEILNDI